MKMSICLRRKWVALLVCAKIVAACCVFGADASEIKPRVSFGIKAGAPLKKFVTLYGSGANTKPYTFGPVMDIDLPRGLGIEVGAMYKRIDQHSTSYTVLGYYEVVNDECSPGDCVFPILQSHPVSTVGRSWEFPIV